MLISPELNAAINEEIGLEFFASHQYINIAAYYENRGLRKLAALFYKQGDEERGHALKFIKYITATGGKVEIPAIVAPKTSFDSVEATLQLSLDWEIEVTKRCNNLMTLAVEQKDYAAQDFLRWFVTEQVEEVMSMENLLSVLQQGGGERSIIMLEAYLVHAD